VADTKVLALIGLGKIMVNQVNSRNSHNVTYADNKQQTVSSDKSNAASLPQSPTAAKTPADSVVITAQAQQIKNLQVKAESTPGFDTKKMHELKKAISEGSYQIDAEKLAKNIANFEFNLYG
jgi:negative regulator of flagellin synthesis FlgM